MWPLLLTACAFDPAGNPGADSGVATPTGYTDSSSNTAPTAPVVEIGPTDPIGGIDDLLCEIVEPASDADGDALTYTTRWTVDGAAWKGSADLVPASETHADETWTCLVTASDGQDDGPPGEASVTTSAFDPSAVDPYIEPDVRVEPNEPVPGSTVTVHYEGVLAAASAIEVVYAFDGWSVLPGMTGYAIEPGEGAEEYAYYTAAMTDDGDGTWSIDIDLPPDARAVHLQFRGAGDVDDRNGLDYHWAVVAPYIGPYLTYNDVAGPSDGVVVNFVTSVLCLGAVELSTEGEPDQWWFGEAFGTDHHIPLTGLSPDTTYTYRVHDSSGRPSPTYAFTTAPADTDAVAFAALSDVQDSGKDDDRWGEVASQLWADHPDIAFVMTAGDMAADDEPGRWWLYFDRARDLFGTVPMVPAVGNHDTPTLDSNPNTSSFERYFDLPVGSGSEAHYALRWGPLLVLTINSEITEELQPGGVQHTWLEEELVANLDGGERISPWVFTQQHHPPYDIGQRFYGNQTTYRPLTELFDGGVDWTVTGHEHLYQRFGPTRFDAVPAPSGDYGWSDEDGVGYLVLPAAGDNGWGDVVPESGDHLGTGALLAYPELTPTDNFVAPEHGFAVIRIDGESIVIDSWTLGSTESPQTPNIRDSIQYTR